VSRKKWSFAVSFVLCLTSLTALAQNKVTGTVTYLQRSALPPNAVVKVTLEDISLADAPAKILAEKEIPTEGKQVPILFELTYSPSDIQRSHHYSVRATIKSGDRLLFTSTTSNPVIINGVPSEIRVVVQPPVTTPLPAVPLEGTHWTLTELISKKVPPADGRAEAYLQFTADGNRISGGTGCNRLTGTYEKNDKALKFRPLATTMMACIGQTSDQEERFKSALEETSRFLIMNDTLILMNGRAVLAKFKAQPEDQQTPNP
jgi:putative lipoprotein